MSYLLKINYKHFLSLPNIIWYSFDKWTVWNTKCNDLVYIFKIICCAPLPKIHPLSSNMLCYQPEDMKNNQQQKKEAIEIVILKAAFQYHKYMDGL